MILRSSLFAAPPIELFDFAATGRGVRATADIAQGMAVLSVREERLITGACAKSAASSPGADVPRSRQCTHLKANARMRWTMYGL